MTTKSLLGTILVFTLLLITSCGGGGGNAQSVPSTVSSTTADGFTYVSASGTTPLRSGHAITFTDTTSGIIESAAAASGSSTTWLWSFGDGSTSTVQNPSHIYSAAGTFTVSLTVTNATDTKSVSQNLVVALPEFTMATAISDVGQSTTIAFAGLAMMTGNLYAQSFFPPGKVADYTGFQYLRDNDPNRMGHNTSFLTRVANNVIYILTDAQLAQLAVLAAAQQTDTNNYGEKRFALMQAFRRLLEGDIPDGLTKLSRTAVKAASRELYLIDGKISFDRALVYATILSQMATTANPNNTSQTQLEYLESMKGFGWSSWPDITDAQVAAKLSGKPAALRTYAGDLFSWYAGSVDADVYFCPERHGTYYGSFYMKDAPAIGHEGYSIDETVTGTAGSVLLTSGVSPYNITAAQAKLMNDLVDTQRSNLYAAGTTSIVGIRTQIATLLRSLLISTASSAAINAQVQILSGTYGDLDGENNYNYATVFAEVYSTLSAAQKTALAGLRTQILKVSYDGGTTYTDFSTCTTPYLYSDVINPITDTIYQYYISDTATDLLFE